MNIIHIIYIKHLNNLVIATATAKQKCCCIGFERENYSLEISSDKLTTNKQTSELIKPNVELAIPDGNPLNVRNTFQNIK